MDYFLMANLPDCGKDSYSPGGPIPWFSSGNYSCKPNQKFTLPSMLTILIKAQRIFISAIKHYMAILGYVLSLIIIFNNWKQFKLM